MSRIDDLAEQYERHISAPWQRNLAGAQRVVFVVYPKEDERRLLVKLKEFEQRTKTAGHGWREVDMSNVFARWMAAEEYREEYFRNPAALVFKFDSEFAEACVARLREALQADDVNDDTVLAVYGVAGLYGFTRLHYVLQKIESHVRGRLVVFFPGSYDQNAYRLLDARDGWNYLATPITGLVNK